MNKLAIVHTQPLRIVPHVSHVMRFKNGDLITVEVFTVEQDEETYRGDITMNRDIAEDMFLFSECVEQLLHFPVSMEFAGRWRLIIGQGIRHAPTTVYSCRRPEGGAATEPPSIPERLLVKQILSQTSLV
ncbi:MULTISPECIES: hypothetical protein [unclassified Phyllobacterium]|uniref:hypothetical protein n=1 Tax=unclassified Phyllobacterium TaxID=2638441 RepID=UPI0030131D3E